MDERAVQYYLNQVPVEIREAVMELDTPYKWAIYIALTVEGDKYFNQLKKQFNANPKTTNDALKSLVASGLVTKKVKQLADIGDSNKTYYSTTKLGEKLLMNLYEVVLPPLTIRETLHAEIGIAKIPANTVELNQPKEYYLPIEVRKTNELLMLQSEGVRT